MTDAPPPGSRVASRPLVIVLLVLAALIAVLPWIVARTRGVQSMRAALAEVMGECRARYAESRTAADSATADAWRPPLHGVQRAGDPTCGEYRRRNMLGKVVE